MVSPVAVGDVLAGKYRVERVLGVGGMGVVVAATHMQLEERVALKFMLAEAYGDAELAARFTREARAAVKLKSEHVARVLDVGTLETGAPYIVMEYLDGTDLAGELEKKGPLRVEDAAEYVLQACDALAEAHALGIVHRDLKPANLFLTRRGDGSPLVKVLDFGISKASSLNESGLAMTKTASMMGSPLYMSPEQMKSAKDVDARADVWALGTILYELVGGRPPFNADTLGALMSAVMMEPPAPLRLVRADIPEAFAALVSRCLEKDRDQRCANVAEVAYGLAEFCPSRSRPLVDRIASILRVSASAPVAAPLSPQMTMPMTPLVAAPAGSGVSPFAGTAQVASAPMHAGSGSVPAFGATTGATVQPSESPRKTSIGWRLAALVAVPLVVLGAGLAGVRAFHGRASSQGSREGMPAPSIQSSPPGTTSEPVSIATAPAATAAPTPAATSTSSGVSPLDDGGAIKPPVTRPAAPATKRAEPPRPVAQPAPSNAAAPAASAPKPAIKKPGLLDESQ